MMDGPRLGRMVMQANLKRGGLCLLRLLLGAKQELNTCIALCLRLWGSPLCMQIHIWLDSGDLVTCHSTASNALSCV